MNKSTILSVGLLAGTIIGAGIFSLPYLFSRIGVVLGVFYLLLFSVVYIMFYFMYSALLLKENEPHDFFKLARTHLSWWASKTSSFFIITELLFALVVYLILAGMFFEFGFGTKGLLPMLLFWICGSVFIFVKTDLLGVAELLGTLSIIGIVAFMFFIGSGPIFPPAVSFLPDSFNWRLLLLPFGPLLFSFSGRPAVSKIVQEYKNMKNKGTPFSFKKSLIFGTALSGLVYLVFVFSVFRLGGNISTDTLSGLTFLSPLVRGIIGFLGLITLWTSYFMIGANIKDILILDARWSKWIAGGISLFFPLLLYAGGFKDFLFTIGFVGGIFIACEGIFVTRMWQNAFPTHPLRKASYAIYIVFFVAIAYEIANTIIRF